jgi:hypothetical protein
MAQTLSWLYEVQSHHVTLMLARAHRSAAKLNLDFDLLEYEQVLLQLKQLSYLCRVRLEQQLVIHGVKPLLLVQHPVQQGQAEVPVVQG